ncbi:hypothetical protein BZARG_1625 [Bizionia argentinensis JUB59]|uniref:Uncharacterized protein n=1 Tax=Bizionia argentinensis JUB59 TaxID=1046627 RepID=G2EER1_9FLAO|nr:hypothetical protein [Bizionia argentinensis]EGV43000.2 hypothetical protein BZARG_1625 [Bizionia argentinensis JUB59]
MFKLIGNAFDRFFRFIANIFKGIFLAFVWLIFFLKKHLIKLAIAGIVGIILGVILDKTSDPVYKSYITVKQNFDIGENLYNAINYYNDLVKQEDLKTLKKVFHMPEDSLASIRNFEIKSVTNEKQKIKRYDDYLQTLDTSVASTVTYEFFLKNDKDYSHDYQQIAITAKGRNSFNAVFSNIIENINTNSYLKREQEKDIKELKEQALAISNSMIKSDTLLSVYQKAIIKSAENNNEFQGKITIENKDYRNSTKEFELYSKDLELKEKLVEIEREIADKKFVIEITSSNQDSGSVDNRKQLFGWYFNGKVFYAFVLLGLTFLVLIGLEFFRFIGRFKDKAA